MNTRTTKGQRHRPHDPQKYGEEHERIFGRKSETTFQRMTRLGYRRTYGTKRKLGKIPTDGKWVIVTDGRKVEGAVYVSDSVSGHHWKFDDETKQSIYQFCWWKYETE